LSRQVLHGLQIPGTCPSRAVLRDARRAGLVVLYRPLAQHHQNLAIRMG
jgi:hypothetical protein